jgi:hypothetical protein
MSKHHHSIPIYEVRKASKELKETTPIAVTHNLTGTWQLINLLDGTIHTPQSFEAEHGFLPECPPSATAKTRKEWTAHQNKNPTEKWGSGQGFG